MELPNLVDRFERYAPEIRSDLQKLQVVTEATCGLCELMQTIKVAAELDDKSRAIDAIQLLYPACKDSSPGISEPLRNTYREIRYLIESVSSPWKLSLPAFLHCKYEFPNKEVRAIFDSAYSPNRMSALDAALVLVEALYVELFEVFEGSDFEGPLSDAEWKQVKAYLTFLDCNDLASLQQKISQEYAAALINARKNFPVRAGKPPRAGTYSKTDTAGGADSDEYLKMTEPELLSELENLTPKLKKTHSTEWAKPGHLKRYKETISLKSLREQKSRGKKTESGEFGVSKHARIWRKDGRDTWYYVPSLHPCRKLDDPLIVLAKRIDFYR